MLLSSGDNFPHLIQKRRSQLGFVTYLLNFPRIFRYTKIFSAINITINSYLHYFIIITIIFPALLMKLAEKPTGTVVHNRVKFYLLVNFTFPETVKNQAV